MSTMTYTVVRKIMIIIALVILLTTPHVVRAEDNIVRTAFKGIFSLFSKDEVEATKEDNVFPEVADRKPTRTILAVMTAYSSEAAQTDNSPCIPADWKYDLCEHYEKYGEQDTIAANFLPLGTKVRFPDLYGDKVFTVRDRMNARYGVGRGDIWMPTKTEAKQFGVKKVTMEIYSK